MPERRLMRLIREPSTVRVLLPFSNFVIDDITLTKETFLLLLGPNPALSKYADIVEIQAVIAGLTQNEIDIIKLFISLPNNKDFK